MLSQKRIASLAEELLDSPPVDQGPAEANSYHQRLGAKWMCEAITREAETTFRLNRNFQAFAKDIGCKWQDDAFWRKGHEQSPTPFKPRYDPSWMLSKEHQEALEAVVQATEGVQRLRLSTKGEALLRVLANKAEKLGLKPPWSDQDIITMCETLPPEMKARLQKEFGLVLTPQNPPVAGPPKRKVLTCNRICAAVFHLTGGAHRTDCQANEPECPTCQAPRWEVHPSATPGGPATKCPDPYHEVEIEP